MSDQPLPTTVDEALAWMDAKYSHERAQIAALDAFAMHHGLGQYLRNTFGLWKKSALAEHMKETLGLEHPDDMSHHLIELYLEWLKKPHPLPGEAGYQPPKAPLRRTGYDIVEEDDGEIG